MVHEVRSPRAQLQIAVRLMSALSAFGVADDVDGSALFHRLGASGETAIGSVRTAYVELFHHVAHELGLQHSKSNPEGEGVTESTLFMVFLPLLRALATMLTPSFLSRQPPPVCYSYGQHEGGLKDSEAGCSLPRARQTPSGTCSVEGTSVKHERASSTSLMNQTDVSKSEAALSSRGNTGALSAMMTAARVLGAILAGAGDILASDTWGKHVADGHSIAVHHAAWKSFSVVCMQACCAVRVYMKQSANSTFHGARQADGERSLSKPMEGVTQQVDTRGAQQWWVTIQAMMSILFNEVTRTLKRLERFKLGGQATDKVLSATGAVRLISNPAILPVPSTLTFRGICEEDVTAGFASSFWIWISNCTTDCVSSSRFASRESCGSSEGNDGSPSAAVRQTIFTRVRMESSDGFSQKRSPKNLPGVFLTPSSTHDGKRADKGADEDESERWLVEFAVLRRKSTRDTMEAEEPRSPETEEQARFPSCVSASPSIGSPPSKSNEVSDTSGYNRNLDTDIFETGRLLSPPLPKDRWTHVCCSFSESERSPLSPGDTSGAGNSSPNADALIYFDGCIVAKHILSSGRIGRDTATSAEPRQAPAHGELENLINEGDSDRSETPSNAAHVGTIEQRIQSHAVCDLYWHPCKVSAEQVCEMVTNGILSQEEFSKRQVEGYVSRLVALVEKIAASSQQAAAALASPRWLLLWLTLARVAGRLAQRAIMRLLRRLLCVPRHASGRSPEGVGPNVGTNSSNHFASCSLVMDDTGDRTVIDHLFGYLGRSLSPLLGDGCSGCPFGVDTEHVGLFEKNDSPCSRWSEATCQQSFVVSEVIQLLRVLVCDASLRWRRHIYSSLTNGLADLANEDLCVSTEATDVEMEGEMDPLALSLSSRLGASVAAVYLGGGHIEEACLGGRVVVLPCSGDHPNTNSSGASGGRKLPGLKKRREKYQNFLSHLCSSVDTVALGDEAVVRACRGTVVGRVPHQRGQATSNEEELFVTIDKEYMDCLDENTTQGCTRSTETSRSSTASGQALSRDQASRVVAVPARNLFSEPDIAEPVMPFMFDLALPSVVALLESFMVPNARKGCVPGGPNSELCGSAGFGLSIITAHLRCRLVRALAVQLRHPRQAAAALSGKVSPLLLAIGATNLASAAIVALGSDGAVAFGRRQDLAAVVLSLGNPQQVTGANGGASLLIRLISADRVVWRRLVSKQWEYQIQRNERDVAQREHGVSIGVSSSCATVQVLGGEVLVEGHRVTASSHFPTIRLSNAAVGSGSIHEQWYYEVTLLTGGLMQLGWAGPSFQCSPVRGQGVGDHTCSWAFDGFREKRWCASSTSYGKRWRTGDVVGVLLDAGVQEMRFRWDDGRLGQTTRVRLRGWGPYFYRVSSGRPFPVLRRIADHVRVYFTGFVDLCRPCLNFCSSS